MNSKISRFFYWTFSAIVGAILFLVGAVCIALPWSEALRTEILIFLLEDSLVLPSFGLGLLLIGCSILIYTFFSTRQRYVDVRTGALAVTVNENVIRHYLDTYWKDCFPCYQISSSIKIKKRAIYIQAHLPALSKPEQHLFYERVQQDLGDIFGRVLGYPHEVFLTTTMHRSH